MRRRPISRLPVAQPCRRCPSQRVAGDERNAPMLKDRYGNLMSTSSQSAVEKFNHACELMRLYRGDPIAALDSALEDDPDCAMAWAARAGVLVQQEDKAYAQEAERSIRAGAAASGNERER